jgi:hypothetical protein
LARYCHECGTSLHTASAPAVGVAKATPQKKAPRKVSAYSKRYGREYKRLKAKHPRASFGSLSKKAHAATKKGLKK